jgi:N-acetylglutamate synthase-like GNAT family acetyltransferase
MNAGLALREALPADLPLIEALLRAGDLSVAGVLAPGTRYWVAEGAAGDITALVGLEFGRAAVLLRSLTVRADLRGQELGSRLVHHALQYAAGAGYAHAYLFSSVRGFWLRQGFERVPVEELVAALGDVPEAAHFAQQGILFKLEAWRKDLGRDLG